MAAIRHHGKVGYTSASHKASVASPRDEAIKRHGDEALDEALTESFPASDPVAVNIAKPVRPKKNKKQAHA